MNVCHYPKLGETVYRDTLPGGLPLVVVPRRGRLGKVAYFVTGWGAIHREFTLDGRDFAVPAGSAHYLEHKLFDMPGGRDISAEFAALGANTNAFTGYDMTAYYFSCTENFEESLKLLLTFVTTSWFTPETVEKERGIIAQEIDMVADSPESRVFENLMEAMYTVHPVRTPILGTRQTVAQITPEVLESCHRAFCHPGSMMLCVVGDVEPERVRDIALQMLPRNQSSPARRKQNWEEPVESPRPEIREAMDVAMPMFQLGFKCESAPRGDEAVRQEIIGDLAAEALFGESSALYLQLYEKGLIDSAFGGGFETVDGMAMLTAYGDSDDPHAVLEAILEGAKSLTLEPVDLERMKRSALGRRVRELDSQDSTCFRLCAYQFDDFDYFRFPELYDRVSAEDVLRFISRVVTRQRCCLSMITPLEEDEP